MYQYSPNNPPSSSLEHFVGRSRYIISSFHFVLCLLMILCPVVLFLSSLLFFSLSFNLFFFYCFLLSFNMLSKLLILLKSISNKLVLIYYTQIQISVQVWMGIFNQLEYQGLKFCLSTLLSLLPLSCMVVLIRELSEYTFSPTLS